MTERQESIDRSSAPRPRDDLAHVEIDGEAVIYDERSGAMHLLDPIATVVWGCLDGAVSLGQIARELADAFTADPSRVEGDVVAVVRSFGGQGLLAGVPAGPEAAGGHEASARAEP